MREDNIKMVHNEIWWEGVKRIIPFQDGHVKGSCKHGNTPLDSTK
jgi:hypothetical protein